MAEKLKDFAQVMSEDRTALNLMDVSRCVAAYKMEDGLAAILKTRIYNMMREFPFSITADEAQTIGNRKVFSILVCFVNPLDLVVETHHLCSVEVS